MRSPYFQIKVNLFHFFACFYAYRSFKNDLSFLEGETEKIFVFPLKLAKLSNIFRAHELISRTVHIFT